MLYPSLRIEDLSNWKEGDIVRFWSRVEKTNSCWSWLLKGTRSGYGVFKVNSK